MAKEHKYKDKDNYKDKDKDKDKKNKRITERITVSYIFGILMTPAPPKRAKFGGEAMSWDFSS